MEEEVLEKIFIAISEKLLSTLLQNQFSYRTIVSRQNGLTFQTNDIKGAEITQCKKMRVKIGRSYERTDGQHKFDCVISRDERSFAVELKAGKTGAAASLSSFANYCIKNKVRQDNANKTLKGTISSFLARLNAKPKINYALEAVNNDGGKVKIENDWYLCLRNKKQLPQSENQPKEFEEIFKNCRILFLDELISTQHKNLAAFKRTMRKVFPLDTKGVLAKYIWDKVAKANETV